ncbi:hypothetical protein TREMEDRAFT_45746 [Tremella mesenterica DSM 1558]|uniref:uncharacterized protein n=1 Tax=Tremella mesenterica (strain ATCC 24925 / CBS 8224 / DSM 1558 / NBRC 9311 / NRRL Y-6157 / RJB 2259-6 / UBC 559-6) TaxID=578456 RepID=UPI00032BF077|nr:uncharacterized protein TREMEDRAFT_45746 [Tremella mesenterica DSM 1558]EIW66632.1 hypothetical protein TREMEDRAFT_45746 [Tremella mesenterica DSM 1558]
MPSARSFSRHPLPSYFLLLLPLLYSLCLADHLPRTFHTLSDTHLKQITQLSPPQWTSVTSGHLEHLLIPRPSGSENNTLVQQYISSVFSSLGWQEDQTPFTDDTPIGPIKFNNLIYTFDPSAPRKLVLAAHFDSKYFPTYPENQFIGATDSAAPCAFLLDLAEALTPLLKERQRRVTSGQAILLDGLDEEEEAETTLQIIFFDGEEAVKDWTDTDSIYGARHLAETWETTFLPATHPLSKRRYSPTPTILNTIDVLILLDLLGDSNPRIHSYYRDTDWLFTQMSDVDKRLRQEGLIDVEKGEEGWFVDFKMRKGMIGDDHAPFLERGVSILHVISNPFPKVWHNLADDASALSLPAMRRWNLILRVFTAEYLGLIPTTNTQSHRNDHDPYSRSVDELQ